MSVKESNRTSEALQKLRGNSFGKLEWAGAFGDLGTLIPFIVGYVGIAKLDPLGIFFTFGVLLILCGFYYKTPVPVQPMKAIGAAAIAQAAVVTPGMIWGAGIFTGLFWLTVGLSGKLTYIRKIIGKPVIFGIILGLGILLMADGVTNMKTDIPVAAAALILTFLLLSNKHIPVMFVLIILGIAAGLFRNPGLLNQLASVRVDFRLPQFALGELSLTVALKGAVILGLPQIPMTLGNAVIAMSEENNRLFPNHPVSESKLAVTHGIMNLFSPIFGGIPVCHGSGGMAGHVRFGARTGGATIILGTILLICALFFSSSIVTILSIFPKSVLGVILFFAGLELAASTRSEGMEKRDYFVMLITAGFSLWNVGLGFAVGAILHLLIQKGIVKI